MASNRFLPLGAGVFAAVGLLAAAFSAEPPVGSLRGRLVVEGSLQPLADVRVLIRPKAPRHGQDVVSARTGPTGEFAVQRLLAGAYDVEPLTTAYENGSHPLTVAEGQVAPLDLRLKPGDPYLNLNIHQHAFLPEDSVRVALNGFRQGESLKLRLMSVGDAALLLENGQSLRPQLTPIAHTADKARFRPITNPAIRVIREWTHSVREVNGEGVFYEFEALGRQKPGIYLIEAHGAATSAANWMLVTDLAVVTKSARGRVLAYATDLKTGAPRPGAELTFFQETRRLLSTRTREDGTAEVTVPGAGGDQVAAVARVGGSLAYSSFYPHGWSEGAPERHRVHVYTDRPVYRPGHRVRYRGLVRRLAAVNYDLPSPTPVAVSVADEQGTVLHETQVTTDDSGAFAGEFYLPVSVAGGAYGIEAKLAGETHYGNFAVASYRKPEWEVRVETPRANYVRGERVQATVSAQYYFGAPVVEGQVHYTVYRNQHWSWWGDDEEAAAEDEEEGRYGGDVVASGDLTTGSDGTARFEFPTDQDPLEGWTGDYDYTVEVDVTDASDRYASGEHTLRVSAGEISLDARAARSVAAPGEKVSVSVRALDLEERPAAGVDLSLAAVLQEWTGGRTVERPLQTAALRSGADGTAQVDVTLPDTGLVLIRVSARDRRGNRIEASTDVWVTSATGGDYATPYPSISVIPDKSRYRIGDTARVLINTDRPGPTAIVALEAEKLLEYRVVPLRAKSTVVSFKIHAGFEPNVFVHACFVRNRELISGEAPISVNAEAHRLKVTVTADRDTYRPGDTAVFRVRTAGSDGRPVPAALSFGLVDEAIYAIRADREDRLWRAFYPRRRNEVNTEFSYPHVYLGDADKGGDAVALRKNFQDTAYWNADLHTNAAGEATLRVRLPDNLTTWRATVQGATAATAVGEGLHRIRVTRDLVVRLQAPRAVTEGDQFTLSALVHNYTTKPLDVRVDLKAAGMKAEGGARTVRVEPERAERVEWQATADRPGQAALTATAQGGGVADGVQLTVPVRPFAREEVVFQAGAVTDAAATETFALNPNQVGGEVELRIAPTLAGAVLGSLDYLVTYPHGCTEQTMSSVLPNLVVLRLLRGLELEKPDLESRVPELTQAGLIRLYQYQHDDGGWGWWENDDSEAWMTAYVLFGLLRAREAGLPVNPRAFANGLDAAKTLAADPKLDPNEGGFLAWVLAEAGAKQAARAILARRDPDQAVIHRRTLGYRLLALLALGSNPERERARAGLQYLWTLADSTGGLHSWAEPRRSEDYGLPADVESTAVILKAAVALTPQDPRLAGVARGLLLRRNGNRWESTRDTAWILFALADYLQVTGELRPDYRVTVRLNGREVHSEAVTPADALREETVVTVPLKGLPADNRLEVQRAGAGTVYYALKVRQEIKTPTFAAESTVPGLTVRREYFRMQTRRDAEGRVSVLPDGRPETRFKVGDRILVRLTIENASPLEYVMLESPLPVGCEVQDRGEMDRWQWEQSGYWWSHQDIRDDRINLFVRSLPPSMPQRPHVIEYYLRPEVGGTLRALPAVLSDMYIPSRRASTPETRLEVAR
jgi:uncharacterized protein YfaS (alpha-2-macroglobulin family)